jgi:hypothetical protein
LIPEEDSEGEHGSGKEGRYNGTEDIGGFAIGLFKRKFLWQFGRLSPLVFTFGRIHTSIWISIQFPLLLTLILRVNFNSPD